MSTVSSAPRSDARSTVREQHLRFGTDTAFQSELRRRVGEFFETQGRRPRDCPHMYFKTALILGAFFGAYALLVFVASAWWQVVPLALLLALSVAAIGFNIQHDGGHQAYSDHPWVNKLSAHTLDLVGASSYIWRWKHAVFHHTYTNVQGHDSDCDLGVIARLTPYQKRYFHQRWQHFYIWILYGIMTLRWQLYGDFRDLIDGRIGERPFPRPRGWDLFNLVAGKLVFVTLAFVIPLLLHPVWVVLVVYAAAMATVGISLSIVFQIAHCVEEAHVAQPESGRIETPWAIHQIQTTVDFARDNALLTWLVGGLNLQVAHHLFPRVCHVHYPALTRLVEDTCRDFGVPYTAKRSLFAGLASHYRWLRRMGRGGEMAAAA
jgi:linoleoyl-CoA desaturase